MKDYQEPYSKKATSKVNSLLKLNSLLYDLSDDLANNSKTDKEQLRQVIKLYKQIQDQRTVFGNQRFANEKNNIPISLISSFEKAFKYVETQLCSVIDSLTDKSLSGSWTKKEIGIGPLIAGQLMVEIDLAKAPTAGHVWRYCGVDPTCQWLGREKSKKIIQESKIEELGLTPEVLAFISSQSGRNPKWIMDNCLNEVGVEDVTRLTKKLSCIPYNKDLKQLVYTIGECIIRTQNKSGSFYGPLFKQRKAYEIQKGEGLSKGQIHARARRWTAKLFLSHWHLVAFYEEYNKLPPLPYVLAHKGHTDFIMPPNLPEEIIKLINNQYKIAI